MIRNPAERNIRKGIRRRGIGEIRQLFQFADDRAQNVGLERPGKPVDRRRRPLQTGTGVDIFLWQRSQAEAIALTLAGKLREDQIPDLQPAHPFAVPVGIEWLIWLQIEENLTARATRSLRLLDNRVRGPVVGLLAQAGHALARQAAGLGPEIVGFVVLLEDRDTQIFRIELEYLGQKLPGPGDRFVLEIIAETKVAHHLKKSTMGRVPDVVNINGPEALLSRCQRGARRRGASLEIGFERHHPGNREKKCRVIGDERVRRKAKRPLLLEELQVFLSKFACLHDVLIRNQYTMPKAEGKGINMTTHPKDGVFPAPWRSPPDFPAIPTNVGREFGKRCGTTFTGIVFEPE